MFDKNYIRSASFNFPIICIGNLAVGGTGKTPMVEYLINIFRNKYELAILSRGYGRKTKGFGIADDTTTALEIGDEPMQFHLKYPGLTIAVGEERLVAIPQLLHEMPGTQVIILDDAFQHRYIRAGLNILLTDYTNLYTRDFVLPGGDLRDVKFSARRADIILVTKCPIDMGLQEKSQIIKELKPKVHQKVFFTAIHYGEPYHLLNKNLTRAITSEADILLVCGIANPRRLKEHLTENVRSYDMLRYADHHIFDTDDLADILKQFNKLKSDNKFILTTEKDAVRLQKFENELQGQPIYVIPISHSFLFDSADHFQEIINSFIESFPKSEVNI